LQVAPAEAPSLQKVSPKVSLDANAERQDGEEAVLVHIAPNKANWDLRRDIAAKLVQLERRTQRAMTTFMSTGTEGKGDGS
jgi:coiled-coil domain-containing protein 12